MTHPARLTWAPRPSRDDVTLEELPDGQAVLVQPSRGELRVLNDVGAAVWLLLDGERPVASLVDEVTTTLGAERATVERDVLAFLDELVRCGAVREPP